MGGRGAWDSSIEKLFAGYGCARCGGCEKLSKEEVLSRLDKVSNGRYTWSDFEYDGIRMKLDLKCNTCDYEWRSTLRMLMHREYGCPRCSNHLKLSKEEVIRRIEDHRKDRYTYDDSFEYEGVVQKIPCECKRARHKFMQTINALMHGTGCPYCSIIKSNPEDSIYNFLSEIYEGDIIRGDRSVIPSPFNTNRYVELDLYIPGLNLAIEFNETYWHSDDIVKKCSNWESAKHKHDYKSEQCKMRGIYLLHIDEKDWNYDCDGVLKRLGRLVSISSKLK